jgi:hypothetical protein
MDTRKLSKRRIEKEKIMSEQTMPPKIPSFTELFGNENILTDEEKKMKVQECNDRLRKTLQQFNCDLAIDCGFALDQEGKLKFQSNVRIVSKNQPGVP